MDPAASPPPNATSEPDPGEDRKSLVTGVVGFLVILLVVLVIFGGMGSGRLHF
jgi:hypothetical protein